MKKLIIVAALLLLVGCAGIPGEVSISTGHYSHYQHYQHYPYYYQHGFSHYPYYYYPRTYVVYTNNHKKHHSHERNRH